MKVIKKGHPDRRYRYECEICGCIFDLTAEERVSNLFIFKGCPCCGNLIDLNKPLKILDSQKEEENNEH